MDLTRLHQRHKTAPSFDRIGAIMARMNDPAGERGWEMTLIYNNAGRALPESSRLPLNYSDKLPDPPEDELPPDHTHVIAIRMEIDRILEELEPSERPEVVLVRLYRIPRTKRNKQLIRNAIGHEPEAARLDFDIPLEVLLQLAKSDPLPRTIKLTQMAAEQPDPVISMPTQRQAEEPLDFVEAIAVYGYNLMETLPENAIPLSELDFLFPTFYVSSAEMEDSYLSIVRRSVYYALERNRLAAPTTQPIPTHVRICRVPTAFWNQAVKQGLGTAAIIEQSPEPWVPIELPPRKD